MKGTLILAGWILLSAATVTAQEEPTIDVEKLADNVYLYTHNVHRSLFVVSGDQILVTDPQSPESAERYLVEVRKISPAPIRYLVYSHHHGDHISGGAAFSEDPIIIGHANVPGHLSGDSDAAIVPVDVTFSKVMSFYLDDLEVRLVYPGPSETDSNIIVFIPERKVAFMVDAVASRRLPWRTLGDGDPYKWVAALEELDTLDFEILAPGHGPTGTKANVREYIQYFTDLTEAVKERIEQGQTLEQIQESLELPAYADWLRYDEHLKLNIEGVYRKLTAGTD
jgi:glyoxylase-like metal-dependent hydrolase (beta-lactamase superfamily II)